MHIQNFRSIKDQEIDFDNLTIFVGRNGSGKSTILNALDYFYSIDRVATIEDFFYNRTDEPIRITITFVDLLYQEVLNVGKWYHDDELIVTKVYEHRDSKGIYKGNVKGFKKIEDVFLAGSNTEIKDAWNKLVEENDFEGLPIASNVPDAKKKKAEYYSEHENELELVEAPDEFLGPRNIGGGIIDNFTKFVYVPAVKEVSDETTGKKGVLDQLIQTIVLRKVINKQNYKDFIENFEGEASKLFDEDNKEELDELAVIIDTELKKYEPTAKFTLSWDEFRLPQIQPPSAIPKLTDHGYEGDISKKGHGLQRTLLFSILTEYNKLSHELIQDDTNSDDDSKDENELAVDLILCIEEPELYQHPLKSRRLYEILIDMSTLNGDRSNNQISYTTHSPNFVSIKEFDSIRKVYRKPYEIYSDSGERSEAFEASIEGYSRQEASHKLAAVHESSPDMFTGTSFETYSASVITNQINEGFFADKILFVEGITDQAVFETVDRKKNYGLLSKGIAVIALEGKTKIDRPYIIFDGLNIPCYIVFDNDKNHIGTDDETDTKYFNRICQKLTGLINGDVLEDFPDESAQTLFACFEGSIEDYIKQEIGEKYDEYWEKAKNDREMKGDKAKKNPAVRIALIENIYDGGDSLPYIEQIIEAVIAMPRN